MRKTNLAIAAERLLADGHVDAYDAVYSMTDDDGRPRRNTRLAATISSLKHQYDWVIKTVEEPGQLARYVLVSVGSLPKGTRPPEPKATSTPRMRPVEQWACLNCGATRWSGERLLGNMARAMCTREKKVTLHKVEMSLTPA